MWESWHIFALRQRIWPLIPGLPKNDQNMMQNLRSFGPKFCFNPWLIGVIEFATMRPFSWNWFQGYFIKSLHLMIIRRNLKIEIKDWINWYDFIIWQCDRWVKLQKVQKNIDLSKKNYARGRLKFNSIKLVTSNHGNK